MATLNDPTRNLVLPMDPEAVELKRDQLLGPGAAAQAAMPMDPEAVRAAMQEVRPSEFIDTRPKIKIDAPPAPSSDTPPPVPERPTLPAKFTDDAMYEVQLAEATEIGGRMRGAGKTLTITGRLAQQHRDSLYAAKKAG